MQKNTNNQNKLSNEIKWLLAERTSTIPLKEWIACNYVILLPNLKIFSSVSAYKIDQEGCGAFHHRIFCHRADYTTENFYQQKLPNFPPLDYSTTTVLFHQLVFRHQADSTTEWEYAEP